MDGNGSAFIVRPAAIHFFLFNPVDGTRKNTQFHSCCYCILTIVGMPLSEHPNKNACRLAALTLQPRVAPLMKVSRKIGFEKKGVFMVLRESQTACTSGTG